MSNRVNSDPVDPLDPDASEDDDAPYAFQAEDVGTRYMIAYADYQDEEPNESSENNNTNCYGPFEVPPCEDYSLVEEFDSPSLFTSTDPDVYIADGKVHWHVYKNGGEQYIYRTIPSFTGGLRLTVSGQVDSATNNCFVRAGVGDATTSGVAVTYGFTGGGCFSLGYIIAASGVSLDFESDGCSFTPSGALWINSQTQYTATLIVTDTAKLSVEGIGSFPGTPLYTGSYDTLYVGLSGTGDYPNCSGTIERIIVEPLCEPLSIADLSITKSDNPDPVFGGSALTYTLSVTNTGPSDATGVIVTDTLPAEVEFVSATPSQGDPCSEVGGTVTCALGTITSGNSSTVSIVVSVAQGATLTISNTAAVAGNEPGANTADNEDTEYTSVQLQTQEETVATGDFRVAVVGDVDNDGVKEIVAGEGGSNTVNIYVFQDNTYVLERSLSFEETPTVLAVGDTDGDGRKELVVGTSNGNAGGYVYVGEISGDAFSLEWKSGRIESFRVSSELSLGDGDGDGQTEIAVAISYYGRKLVVYEYDGNGYSIAWQKSIGSDADSAHYADTDGDGTAELLVGLGCHSHYGVEVYDASTRSFRKLGLGQTIVTGGDVDGDGVAEVVAGIGCKCGGATSPFPELRIWKHTGAYYSPVYTSPKLVEYCARVLVHANELIGGGAEEIAYGTDAPDNNIGVYQWNGSTWDVLWSHSADAGLASVWIGDTDSDGANELVASSSLWLKVFEFYEPISAADLAITKSDNPDPVTTGGTLTYTLSVTNTGPSNATGVIVTDTLPAQVAFVAAMPSQGGPCSEAGGTVICDVGSLSVGESATVTVVVAVDLSTTGTITNTATVTGNESDPDRGNNITAEDTTVHTSKPLILTGKRIQIPRIDKGAGWDTRIQIQNVGDGPTGVITFFWGDYSTACPPSAPGPVAHLCYRIPGSWGTQAVQADIPADAESAIVYSVSDDLFEAACEAAGNYEAWLNWEDTYAYSGEPLAVAVDRLMYNGSSASSTYSGFSETMLGSGSPGTYFASHIMHGYNGLDTTLTLQNSGDVPTSIWIYYKAEGNCEFMKAQHIECLVPGEAIHIGPGPNADVAFPSPEVDPPWLGSAFITSSEPLAIVVDRWDTNSTMLLTHGGVPYPDYGATINYVPLIYQDVEDWNAEIHVQNMTQASEPTFVTALFYDQSGDEILFVGDWICRNGTTTFYLADNAFPLGYVGAVEIESHDRVDYPGGQHPGEPIASVITLMNSNGREALSYHASTPQQIAGVTAFAVPLISKESNGVTSRMALRNNSNCNKLYGEIWLWAETGTAVAMIPVPWVAPKHQKIFDLAYFGQIAPGFVGAATFEVMGVEQLCDVDGNGHLDNEPVMPSVVVIDRDPDDAASGQEAFPIKYGPVVVVIEMAPSSPVKAETVEFAVMFPEQMNTTVPPTVTIGMNALYTDYTIIAKTGDGYTNGYLDGDPTKWYGTYTFTETMGDGMYHVSVAGAEDSSGNPIATDTLNVFVLDTTPPSSSVTDLPAYQSTLSFPVSWSGSDATAGTANYDAQYRDGAGSWTDWLTDTIETSATFTGEDGHTYHFQSRARDNAGNVEAYPDGDGDTHTTVDVVPPILSGLRVTNVRDASFTVSWITDIPSDGHVSYGIDPATLNQIAYEDRGPDTFDDTHYVTLLGMTPNTTYYFDVVSGPTTDNNGGDHYSVTTGPTLGLPPSDQIYGQVFKEDGTTLAEGTIVYITLFDDNGSGSPDEAAPLSALVDDTGYWNTNLANARTADLSAYFTYSASGDRVRLEAQGAADGTGCLLVDTADDSPAADLILSVSTCLIEVEIPLQIGWNHISLPLEPVTPYTAEGVCDEIISQSGDVTEIDRWYASGWDGHVCGLPFNDFDIELGSDYFIKSSAASTWTIEGHEVTTGVPLELQVGWNSIGIPHTDAYTAESLCEEINDQCGDGTAVEVDRWYASGWDGHICGLPFNDFAIEIGKGYFVKASGACTVTPSLAALSIGRWRMENGEWRMENGQWTMDNGQWTTLPLPSSPFPLPSSPFPLPSSPFPLPSSPFPLGRRKRILHLLSCWRRGNPGGPGRGRRIRHSDGRYRRPAASSAVDPGLAIPTLSA